MKKFIKFLINFISVSFGLFIVLTLVNLVIAYQLKSYINLFDPVIYDELRDTPEYSDELNHYVIKTDDEVSLVNLSDIHLGGGFLSIRKDRECIKQVCTILQNERPELVVMNGDNVYAVPIFSGTFNNLRTSKILMYLFDHMGVYYSTTFGNHESEIFNTTSRIKLAEAYEKGEHSIFKSEFNEVGVSNQLICIQDKNTELVTKNVLLLDSNDYTRSNLKAVIGWDYDIIHEEQVAWAKEQLEKIHDFNEKLVDKLGSLYEEFRSVKTIGFCHIPLGEFEIAYQDQVNNNWEETSDSKYICGVFNKELSSVINDGRIWFGGSRQGYSLGEEDNCFEELNNYLEFMFFGHDHVNNAVIEYKGVKFGYNYSIDNIAYFGIKNFGLQRGCTVFNIKSNGATSFEQKNIYMSDYIWQFEPRKVNLDSYMYSDFAPNK